MSDEQKLRAASIPKVEPHQINRDDLADLISKAGAPPGPPDGPIGALPDGHWAKVAAYRQADAVIAALSHSTRDGEAKPSWFAVQSVSGTHIGMWQDETIARRVFNEEYPDGRFIPLYAAPQPAPVVTEDMVGSVLDQIGCVRLGIACRAPNITAATLELISRVEALTAALQKQESGE